MHAEILSGKHPPRYLVMSHMPDLFPSSGEQVRLERLVRSLQDTVQINFHREHFNEVHLYLFFAFFSR
jgi:hypothetical protein